MEAELLPSSTSESLLEECSYCHRKFRFDRIAKHETRCPESKPKPVKLDVVRKLLAGTPGEQHIPAARQDVQSGKKLPPLILKPQGPWGTEDLSQCNRCGRCFSEEALSKHTRHCNATPRQAAATSREGAALQAPIKPRGGERPTSSRSTRSRTSSAGSREPKESPMSRAPNTTAGNRSSVHGPLLATDADKRRNCSSVQPSYEQLEVDVSDWLDD